MAALDNTTQQISVLTETYRMLLAEADITRSNLKEKIIAAQTTMEDGSEMTALSFEGGASNSMVLYPKEVVLASALQVYRESDPAIPVANRGLDESIIHSDFSWTRIES